MTPEYIFMAKSCICRIYISFPSRYLQSSYLILTGTQIITLPNTYKFLVTSDVLDIR